MYISGVESGSFWARSLWDFERFVPRLSKKNVSNTTRHGHCCGRHTWELVKFSRILLEWNSAASELGVCGISNDSSLTGCRKNVSNATRHPVQPENHRYETYQRVGEIPRYIVGVESGSFWARSPGFFEQFGPDGLSGKCQCSLARKYSQTEWTFWTMVAIPCDTNRRRSDIRLYPHTFGHVTPNVIHAVE
jgi:hypothetical protein